MELVRTEGTAKQTTARLASLGVNGAGLTVMLAVFASTGGITGLEAVVAGGTSAVGHKLLEALARRPGRALARRARPGRPSGSGRQAACGTSRTASPHCSTQRPPGRRRSHASTRDRQRPTDVVSVDLDRRLTALAEAVGVANGRLDPEAVEAARRVTDKAGARLGLGIESTVVALVQVLPAGASLCSSTP